MRMLLPFVLAVALLSAACASEVDLADSSAAGASDSGGAPGGATGLAADTTIAATAPAEGEDAAAPEEAAAEETDADEPATGPAAQAGLLTAADVDDNLNHAFFADYLRRTAEGYGQALPAVDIGERLVFDVTGSDGGGLANARLDIDGGQGPVAIYTGSGGAAYFFPGLSGASGRDELAVTVSPAGGDPSQTFTVGSAEAGGGRVALQVDGIEGAPPARLDVALVIDTTGSMADELRYLTIELESIVDSVTESHPEADLRFALIVYRDDGDDYVTKVYDFTGDPSEIRAHLAEQVADGGGDYPEALDQAVAEAVDLDWRDGDVSRVLLLNGDAPPHDDRFDDALAATGRARATGIRIYPLAASGVGEAAEYLMRIMAATTGGRHLFLTDDSGVGLAHQEPKVQCYVVTRLDQLLVRVLAAELSGERVEPSPDQVIRTVGDYDNGYCSDQG